MTSSLSIDWKQVLELSYSDHNAYTELTFKAGIAQLGEQQTEVLEVACSIHAPGIQAFSRCECLD